jgi:ABC-2 type transport system ATP-binding protein
VERIGDLAFDHRIRLHELTPAQASLEEAFMELTADSVEFRAHGPGEPGGYAASGSDRVQTTGVA